MTANAKRKSVIVELKTVLEDDEDRLRILLQELLQEFLEQEMTKALAAAPSERTSDRAGYRAATIRAVSSPAWASWNCGFPETGTVGFAPICSSATSVPSKPWWALWRRCRSGACRRAT